MITRNGNSIFGTAAMRGVRRAAPIESGADAPMQTWKMYAGGRPSDANGASKMCRICRSFAIAYMEMPDENTVMKANENALNARVFSSNRSRRYSGTDRARDP